MARRTGDAAAARFGAFALASLAGFELGNLNFDGFAECRFFEMSASGRSEGRRL